MNKKIYQPVLKHLYQLSPNLAAEPDILVQLAQSVNQRQLSDFTQIITSQSKQQTENSYFLNQIICFTHQTTAPNALGFTVQHFISTYIKEFSIPITKKRSSIPHLATDSFQLS